GWRTGRGRNDGHCPATRTNTCRGCSRASAGGLTITALDERRSFNDHRPPLQRFLYRRTGAEQVSVPVNVIDPCDGRPEFVFARPRRGKSRLLTGVWPVPVFGSNLPRGVGRAF